MLIETRHKLPWGTMIKLESFYHLHEAQMLVDELEREHIPAFVSSERRGAAGALPFTQAYCEVFIDADGDEARAREILKRMGQERRDKGRPDVVCAACGEENPAHFALCWKCGKELEAAANPSAEHAATRRIISPQRTTGVRVAWAAASLLPAALLFMQGEEASAVMVAIVATMVLWLLSGVHAADYCANCHASMANRPTACSDCGRAVEGEIEQEKFVAGGGRALSGGMKNAITVLCAILVVSFACLLALVSVSSPRRPIKQVRPAAAMSR